MTTAVIININDGFLQTPAVGGETTINFDFPIYEKSHLTVLETDTNGVITKLELGTDYTIATSELENTNGGEIALTAGSYPSGATAGHKFTCLLTPTNERTTDFNQSGDYFADTLNKELDLLTQQIQAVKRDLGKSASFAQDSTLTNFTFTDAPQDGYGVVWDGTSGDVRNTTASLATLEGDAATVAGISGDVTTVAGISANVTTVAGISANVTTVAGISGNVTTVAGISSDVTTVAGISANVTTVAGDSADIQSLAPVSADIATLADIEDGTVATNAIQTAAGISANITTVAGISGNVTTVAGISSDVTTVAGVSANVTTVAGISSDITTVAGIASDVTAAANNIPKANRTATTDPTTGDDTADGYSEGSLWVNTNTDAIFFCADASLGAAVWTSVAGTFSGLSDTSFSGLASGDFVKYNGSNWVNNTAVQTRSDLFDGASITAATVATTDKILIQDTDDSDNLKTATVQSVLDLSSGATGLGQCRLEYSSATELILNPHAGNLITIAGANYQIPSAGVTVNTTGLSSSTLYYVYAYDSSGVTLELSATAPTTDTTSGNIGVEIKTGDNSRTLVGMAYTNGSTQFVDATDRRFVLSYFNRKNIHLKASFSANRSTTSASYVELNSQIRNEFITWGDEAVDTSSSGPIDSTASGVQFGITIGVDGTTSDGNRSRQSASNSYDDGYCLNRKLSLSVGYHYTTVLGKTANASFALTVRGSGSAGDRGILETIIRG